MDLLLLFLLYFLLHTHFCISVHKLNPQGKIETFLNDNVQCVKLTSFRILEDADARFSSLKRRKGNPKKGDFLFFPSQMDANAKKGA